MYCGLAACLVQPLLQYLMVDLILYHDNGQGHHGYGGILCLGSPYESFQFLQQFAG